MDVQLEKGPELGSEQVALRTAQRGSKQVERAELGLVLVLTSYLPRAGSTDLLAAMRGSGLGLGSHASGVPAPYWVRPGFPVLHPYCLALFCDFARQGSAQVFLITDVSGLPSEAIVYIPPLIISPACSYRCPHLCQSGQATGQMQGGEQYRHRPAPFLSHFQVHSC